MKPFHLMLAALATLAWVASPSSIGQNTSTDTLVAEVSAQQQEIAANHAKIDEKLAAISEELRTAKIFVSRGGTKK